MGDSGVVTRVLSFGDGGASSFVIEIDKDKHLDADGNLKSSFLPGEEVFVLLLYDQAIKVIRVVDTAGGDLQRIGEVTRSRKVEITFTHADDLRDLPHLPSSSPSVKWFGRSSDLVLKGRQLQAATAPCLGEIDYSFVAIQYRYRPPGGMVLLPGEKFPVDLVIETVG